MTSAPLEEATAVTARVPAAVLPTTALAGGKAPTAETETTTGPADSSKTSSEVPATVDATKRTSEASSLEPVTAQATHTSRSYDLPDAVVTTAGSLASAPDATAGRLATAIQDSTRRIKPPACLLHEEVQGPARAARADWNQRTLPSVVARGGSGPSAEPMLDGSRTTDDMPATDLRIFTTAPPTRASTAPATFGARQRLAHGISADTAITTGDHAGPRTTRARLARMEVFFGRKCPAVEPRSAQEWRSLHLYEVVLAGFKWGFPACVDEGAGAPRDRSMEQPRYAEPEVPCDATAE